MHLPHLRPTNGIHKSLLCILLFSFLTPGESEKDNFGGSQWNSVWNLEGTTQYRIIEGKLGKIFLEAANNLTKQENMDYSFLMDPGCVIYPQAQISYDRSDH